MTDQQFQYLMQLYGGGGSSSPSAGSYPQFRQGVDPFISGQPLSPNQLSPNPNIFRASTDPNVWLDDPSFPSARPFPVGTGQVPTFPNEPAQPATTPVNYEGPGSNTALQMEYHAMDTDLFTRMTQRAIREGDLGNPAGLQALPPDSRPGMQFGDPSIEPTPIPVGGMPHEGMDVPPGVYPPFMDLPVDPFGQPSGIPENPFGTDTVHLNVNAPNPPDNPYAGIYNELFPPPPTPDWSGNLSAGTGMAPPTDLGDFDNLPDMSGYQQPSTVATGADTTGGDFQWPFFVDQFPGGGAVAPPDDTSGGGGGFAGGAAGTPPTGYYSPSGPNPVGGADPGLLPNAPGFNYAPPTQGMLDANGNVIPGTAVSPEGNANAFNMTQFPGGGGVGQFFTDTAGNIIDGAGKIVAAAGDAAKTFAQRLAGVTPSGYNTNVPGGPYWNADTGGDMGKLAAEGAFGPVQTGPNTQSGLERLGSDPSGRGGFFGSQTNFNPDINSPTNPFGVGQVGSSSVPAPQGGGGPPMYGPTSAAALWGRGNGEALHWLTQMRKGIYTTPQNFGLMKHAMPSPWASQPLGSTMNPGWNWNAYHGGQVDFHNRLVNEPGFYQSIVDRFRGGSEQPAAAVPTSQMMHATSGKYSPK
jgi:hypothetical protein